VAGLARALAWRWRPGPRVWRGGGWSGRAEVHAVVTPAARLSWVAAPRVEGPAPPVNNLGRLVARLSGWRWTWRQLEAALGDVVARHESLRTVYPEVAGRPLPAVLERRNRAGAGAEDTDEAWLGGEKGGEKAGLATGS